MVLTICQCPVSYTHLDVYKRQRGVSYTLVTPTYEEEIFVPVPGKFTVYNTLAVIAACYMLNISKEIVKESLGKTKGVAGRFETITNDKGISCLLYTSRCV